MEIFGKRPWIQAAIDKFTLEEAIPCAQMAVDCGVDLSLIHICKAFKSAIDK